MRAGVKERNTAAFMKLVNNTDNDDTLFSVQSDLAEVVELHETFTKENDMKGMRSVDEIIIPANSTLELKPGSHHVMLIGLFNDLNKNDSGEIQLTFRKKGKVNLNLKAK